MTPLPPGFLHLALTFWPLFDSTSLSQISAQAVACESSSNVMQWRQKEQTTTVMLRGTHTCELTSVFSMDFFNVFQKGGAHTVVNPLFVLVVIHRPVRSLVHEVVQQ